MVNGVNLWKRMQEHLEGQDFTLPYGFSPQWPVEWPMWCPLDKENPSAAVTVNLHVLHLTSVR
jgi:hypothetical protein